MSYQIHFPDDFVDDVGDTAGGGYLALRVSVGHQDHLLAVYDPVRLAQEITQALSSGHPFAEHHIVVVPLLIRPAIEAAVLQLIEREFFR